MILDGDVFGKEVIPGKDEEMIESQASVEMPAYCLSSWSLQQAGNNSLAICFADSLVVVHPEKRNLLPFFLPPPIRGSHRSAISGFFDLPSCVLSTV